MTPVDEAYILMSRALLLLETIEEIQVATKLNEAIRALPERSGIGVSRLKRSSFRGTRQIV